VHVHDAVPLARPDPGCDQGWCRACVAGPLHGLRVCGSVPRMMAALASAEGGILRLRQRPKSCRQNCCA
jgi:hypothetical protein